MNNTRIHRILAEIGRRAPAPNVANMLEGGKTPILPRDQLAELGFQLILYPLAALFAAGQAIEAIYRKRRSDGTTLGAEDRLMAFDQLNDVIGVVEARSYRPRLPLGDTTR